MSGVPRAVFRFVAYDLVQDQTAEVVRSIMCVTGGDSDCGATSGFVGSEDECVEWIRRHARDNPGHHRFQRAYVDYAVLVLAEKDST
ncbi:hypothetical protein RKE29_04865 [Streptomyces sp. B1866]|uniref:DUF7848 domain-containing protein n=1 Tax=Streptomyces sp. B1866 TaxID=3075431 RepID=UPI002890FE20|nr:hypothetical protein [Streptomyces sp. B1866]MDT3395979.1 hypothetical protein [Streptomyces sp. B1866]